VARSRPNQQPVGISSGVRLNFHRPRRSRRPQLFRHDAPCAARSPYLIVSSTPGSRLTRCKTYLTAGQNTVLTRSLLEVPAHRTELDVFPSQIGSGGMQVTEQTLESPVRLGERAQWSEKGSQTMRLPVTQLRVWQKGRPISRSAFGGEAVKTTGSYPYVRWSAWSQPT